MLVLLQLKSLDHVEFVYRSVATPTHQLTLSGAPTLPPGFKISILNLPLFRRHRLELPVKKSPRLLSPHLLASNLIDGSKVVV